MAESKKSTSWQAGIVRATVFRVKAKAGDHRALLQELTQITPSEIKSEPTRGVLAEVVDPPDSNYLLVSQQEPLRADLLVAAKPTMLRGTPAVPDPAPTFAEPGAALEAIAKLIPGWCAVHGPINRIAVGANLRQVASSKEEVADILSLCVSPLRLEASSIGDFVLKLNRQTNVDFGSRSLKINRGLHWAGIVVEIRIASSAEPSSLPHFAATFEIDVSTDAELREELPAKDVPNLFRILLDQATQLAANGDPLR